MKLAGASAVASSVARSSGEGRYATIASSNASMPIEASADAAKIGNSARLSIPERMPALSSSLDISSPSRYFIIKSSSDSTSDSIASSSKVSAPTTS